MTLPIRALGLLFKNFKLLALAFFPGMLTFLGSVAVSYYVWLVLLVPYSWWIEVPGTTLVFFLSWLILGNLSLIPVEDWIIDEVQKAQLGSVRYPSRDFSIRRILGEAGFSLAIAVFTIVLFFISLIPGSWPLTFACAAWLTSYGFLSTLYGRSTTTVRQRLRLFSQDWLANLMLGAFLNLLLFIPVVNVFLLGYALILSTLVYVQRRSRALQ